ncbi:MAG: enoyl-CoA hydratase [Comamonadaceae bacterium]|nr:MAG: enoyl-CoA hydratase [Comamonadaceae bacterium]
MSTTLIDTGTSELLCERRDRVAILTMNRPDARNALSDRMSPALRRMIRQLGDDPSVGALVLTGTGEAFCAGGDVKGMGNASGPSEPAPFDERLTQLRERQRALTGALAALRIPTLALLPGPAAGAGLSLALACDLRIASTSAFVMTGFTRIALSGDYGISYLLTRAVGSTRARELMYLSRRVPADRCKSIGLFNEVVAPDELQRIGLEWARELAHGPGQALRAMKDNLDEASHLSLSESLDREAERMLRSAEHPDHAEAVCAYIEKRAARFAPNPS